MLHTVFTPSTNCGGPTVPSLPPQCTLQDSWQRDEISVKSVVSVILQALLPRWRCITKNNLKLSSATRGAWGRICMHHQAKRGATSACCDHYRGQSHGGGGLAQPIRCLSTPGCQHGTYSYIFHLIITESWIKYWYTYWTYYTTLQFNRIKLSRLLWILCGLL